MNNQEESGNVQHICPDCANDRVRLFHEGHPNIHKMLQPGDYVKVPFRDKVPDSIEMITEWMWVQITSIEGKRFSGRLDNIPFHVRNVKLNTVVLGHVNKICGWIPMNPAKPIDKPVKV